MFGSTPPPPTPEELKRQLALGLLEMTSVLEPLYDAADGMRRDLESRGWSPTQAEKSAGAWLTAMLTSVGGAGR